MDSQKQFDQWGFDLMDVIIAKMEKAYEMGRQAGRKEIIEKAEAVMKVKEDEDSG